MIKRLGLVLCLAVVATLPVGCGDGDGGQNGAGQSPSMPAIHVRDRRLVDDLGREWQLRGINARIEGLFDVTFDDGRTRLEPLAAGWNVVQAVGDGAGEQPEGREQY